MKVKKDVLPAKLPGEPITDPQRVWRGILAPVTDKDPGLLHAGLSESILKLGLAHLNSKEMIAAYIDESGNDGRSAIFAMATILLGYEAAYYFGNDWQALLGKFGVNEFHANQFHRRLGEFRWKDDRAQDFLNEVLRLFQRWQVKHSAQLILNNDYLRSFVQTGFSTTLVPAIRNWRKPYPQAFMETVLDLRDYASHQEKGLYITPVFDDCQEFMGQARRDYRARNKDRRLGEMQVSNTRDHIQLQAADFIAWEYRVNAERCIQTGSREPGATLASLLEHGFGASVWDLDRLEYLRKRVEAVHSGIDPETVTAPVFSRAEG